MKYLKFPRWALLVVALLLWVWLLARGFYEMHTTIPLELPPAPESVNRNWGVDWNDEDLYCLALNIYFEARGEPVEGKYAVGDVVMYRTQHADYPNSVCEVIKAKGAFSWYNDEYINALVDGKAFEEALFISEDILTDPQYPGMVNYSLFYHATYIDPYWADDRAKVARIGGHVFYSSALKRGDPIPNG